MVLSYLGRTLNGETFRDNFYRFFIALAPIYLFNILEQSQGHPITPRETWNVLGSMSVGEAGRQAALSLLRRRNSGVRKFQ